MRKPENVVFTNMCMVYDGQGRVLVQNRVDPGWSGITFPGGHVEYGEPFADAVIREVYEETGLTVSGLRMCGVKDFMREDGSRYVVLLYKTDHFEGEVRSSDEGEVAWVSLDALPQMKLAPGMLKLLRVFREEAFTEYFLYDDAGKWKDVLK